MSIKNRMKVGAASLLTLGLVWGTVPAANAQTLNEPGVIQYDLDASWQTFLDSFHLQETEQKLAEGFETLFTHIITQDEAGKWNVVNGFEQNYPDFSREQAESLARAMNDYDQGVLDGVSTKGAKEYGICVLKGIIPLSGVVTLDWGNVAIWIKQHSWGKLSKYLAKHAAKLGIRDLAKFTPYGLAGSLAASAVSCAIWG